MPPACACRGLVVGIASGAVVSLFRLAISHGLTIVQHLYAQPTVGKLAGLVAVSVVIAVVVGLLLKSEPNISGSGIPQVEGQLQGTMEFPWWGILWKKFTAGCSPSGQGCSSGEKARRFNSAPPLAKAWPQACTAPAATGAL